ncbi:hypothetical protein HK098_000402 [Nowakowskiella sp. JEL0407]|nr:hypothetical protein HK098_000402 [Nowakowskiella sp. JEL0407]
MVSLDGDLLWANTTINGVDKQVQMTYYYYWDLFYFILFNRFQFQFDVPTLLIIFIDGFTWKKKVAFCFIAHWIFRSLGGITYGIAKYLTQGDYINGWKYPSDSYPFQKAWPLAGNKLWLKIISCIGFVPLVLYKIFLVVYRYYAIFNAKSSKEYFKVFNALDAIAITMTAWNDIFCCFVIVYVGIMSRKKSEKSADFVKTLINATELRLTICTILSMVSATLMLTEQCDEDSVTNKCKFTNARNIAVNIVYGLYYLDYLIIKFFGSPSSRSNSHNQQGLKFNVPGVTGSAFKNFDRGLKLNVVKPSNFNVSRNEVEFPQTSSLPPLSKAISRSHPDLRSRTILTAEDIDTPLPFSPIADIAAKSSTDLLGAQFYTEKSSYKENTVLQEKSSYKDNTVLQERNSYKDSTVLQERNSYKDKSALQIDTRKPTNTFIAGIDEKGNISRQEPPPNYGRRTSIYTYKRSSIHGTESIPLSNLDTNFQQQPVSASFVTESTLKSPGIQRQHTPLYSPFLSPTEYPNPPRTPRTPQFPPHTMQSPTLQSPVNNKNSIHWYNNPNNPM